MEADQRQVPAGPHPANSSRAPPCDTSIGLVSVSTRG